jgi:hypothetical protein
MLNYFLDLIVTWSLKKSLNLLYAIMLIYLINLLLSMVLDLW